MFDLDRMTLDVPCPQCRFESSIFYRQARLRDVIICRGCKTNIGLDDHMNECRKARKQINQAITQLEKSIASLNKTFTIKF
jgi:hypothetical protein